MMDPIIGQCDRCGKDIFKREGEEFTMLKASHYKFELNTFTVMAMICQDCSQSFYNRWMTGKGG